MRVSSRLRGMQVDPDAAVVETADRFALLIAREVVERRARAVTEKRTSTPGAGRAERPRGDVPSANRDDDHDALRDCVAYFLKFHYQPLAALPEPVSKADVWRAAARSLSGAPWMGRYEENLEPVVRAVGALVRLKVLIKEDAHTWFHRNLVGHVAALRRSPDPDEKGKADEVEQEWTSEELPGAVILRLADRPPAFLAAAQIEFAGAGVRALRDFGRRLELSIVEGWTAAGASRKADLKNQIRGVLKREALYGNNADRRVVIKLSQYHGRTWFGDHASTVGVLEDLVRDFEAKFRELEVRFLLVSPRAEPALRESTGTYSARASHSTGSIDLLSGARKAKGERPSRLARARAELRRARGLVGATHARCRVKMVSTSEEGLFRGAIVTVDDRIVLASQVVWRFGVDRGIYGISMLVGGDSNLALLLDEKFDAVFADASPVGAWLLWCRYWALRFVLPHAVFVVVGVVFFGAGQRYPDAGWLTEVGGIFVGVGLLEPLLGKLAALGREHAD